MSAHQREEQIRSYLAYAKPRFVALADRLLGRQIAHGNACGSVAPYAGSDEVDFHGTLQAISIWARSDVLEGSSRFRPAISAGWGFIKSNFSRFIPAALGPDESDEAAYDCAMLLFAAMSDAHVAEDPALQHLPDTAARLLAAYLTDLEDFRGRAFDDPGFIVWVLGEYARLHMDRGQAATARRFVDRAWGMKSPSAFASEAVSNDGLFDFSSTTATRIEAIIAAEGATPLVGAWLRERVTGLLPTAFVPRPMDENCWNASAAAAIGRAYLSSTDETLFRTYVMLMAELDRRAGTACALSRGGDGPEDTFAAFYYSLALDALSFQAGTKTLSK